MTELLILKSRRYSCIAQALVFTVGLLCLAAAAHAQQWSGIVAPTRAVDWSRAGVTGGIPHRTTTCASLSPGVTAAQINTALSDCSAAHPNDAGGVVQLAAGDYSPETGLMLQSNVTLQGAGADQTHLNFTGSAGYYWSNFLIGAIGSYTGGFEGSPPGPDGANPANIRSWIGTDGVVGTYGTGSTVLTLDTAPTGSPSLQVGDMLQLVQNDDTAPTSGLFVCSSTSTGCSREDSGSTHGTGQRQNVKVVGISGNLVTISPGIYTNNWTSAKSPKAYWWGGDIRRAGVENLSVGSSLSLCEPIVFYQASDSWMSGVAFNPTGGDRTGVTIRLSRNVTIQDSFINTMHGGGCASSTSYGIEAVASSAFLILNNVLNQVESPIIYSAGNAGSVTAYNYDVGGAPFSQTGLASHEVGSMMNLFEGNDTYLMRADTFHGTQNLTTMFRNVVANEGQASIDTWAYNRYYNIIGNVLGSSAANRCDCLAPDSSGQCFRDATPSVIYRLGFAGANSGPGPEAGVSADPLVAATAMRWGNYDSVNAAARFVSSDVPSGLSQYANPVPASQSLPASFFLDSKPGFFAAGTPWPPIGPDVTGGTMSGNGGGHAYTIPARNCYTSISGNINRFNAVACYGDTAYAPSASLPNAPTNLSIH
jgi:hypothetical protein